MIIKEFFFKIQGQFKDKVHFFRIPGVFQDQGHFQGLFKVCANPVSINIKVLLLLHTKFQPNIPSRSGENDDFISFAIFGNGGHFKFSTGLTFTILKLLSLIMLHMKFMIHGCSGLRE